MSELLKGRISSLGQLLGRKKILIYAEAWKNIIGPALINICEYRGLHTDRKGQLSLRISIKDPLWRQELHFQKEDILKRYRSELIDKGMHSMDLPVRIEF